VSDSGIPVVPNETRAFEVRQVDVVQKLLTIGFQPLVHLDLCCECLNPESVLGGHHHVEYVASVLIG
jgi:hypothetical protein